MPPLLPLLSASAEVCRAHFYTSTTNRSTGSQHATYNVSRIDTFIDHRFQHETGIDRYCHRGFHGVQQGIPPKTEALRQTIQHFFISNIAQYGRAWCLTVIDTSKQGNLGFWKCDTFKQPTRCGNWDAMDYSVAGSEQIMAKSVPCWFGPRNLWCYPHPCGSVWP